MIVIQILKKRKRIEEEKINVIGPKGETGPTGPKGEQCDSGIS